MDRYAAISEGMVMSNNLRQGGDPMSEDTTAPYFKDDAVTLYLGDALDVARQLPSGAANCIVTSPP